MSAAILDWPGIHAFIWDKGLFFCFLFATLDIIERIHWIGIVCYLILEG